MENVLGARIRKLRKSKKWTLDYLGSKLVMDGKPVRGKTLGNWELGVRTPSPEIISQIADVFGVPNDYLMGKDVPNWAKNSDILDLNEIIGGDTKTKLAFQNEVITKQDRDNILNMITFYFWEKKAKERGLEMQEKAKQKNDLKEKHIEGIE